ncbi:hypothetical protein NA57DRAFT_81101 [Rhizodiscina lignyota]|uniref:Nudix hydrolase domain-containing protein n=1 Tax=Rhizodiscina lignyota TaxID=1504668 RepID=A0A9P4I4E9_9PEZI|nr:hypothetical protein NA57DRAFT_81101 [Rhizodiscina lignyota]
MSSVKDHKPDPALASGKKKPMVPRPSSSVLLISPTNQVLLLHRVQTSTSFASAHVFPGGNVSEFHDGRVPNPNEPGRHEDGPAYRNAAIRETFEESGILLARNNGFGRLIEVPEDEREEGRKMIHNSKISFPRWLAQKGGRPDVDGLMPFTRWITPPNVPKRYTTQMYLYFLPLATESSAAQPSSGIGPLPTNTEAVIATPKHDGGIEHTSARFLPAAKWLELARAGKIILFPPQFFLLYQVDQFLHSPSSTTQPLSSEILKQQRKQLMDYVRRPASATDPPWAEVCISPIALMMKSKDGRGVLALDKPGPELKGSNRRGVREWVVPISFRKEGPRQVDVMLRREAFDRERDTEETDSTGYGKVDLRPRDQSRPKI